MTVIFHLGRKLGEREYWLLFEAWMKEFLLIPQTQTACVSMLVCSEIWEILLVGQELFDKILTSEIYLVVAGSYDGRQEWEDSSI